MKRTNKLVLTIAGVLAALALIFASCGNPAGNGDAGTTLHTVTFNSNGGSTVASVNVAEGTTVTKPADPSKSSFTFVDWYTDEALTTPYNFSTLVSAPITLYAKWEAALFSLASPTAKTLNKALESHDRVRITGVLTLADATISLGTTNPATLSVGSPSSVTFPANTVFDTTTNTIDIGKTTNLIINSSSYMTLNNGAGIKAGGLVISAGSSSGSNEVGFSGLAAGKLIENGVLTVTGTAKVEATGTASIQAGDDTNYVHIQGGTLNPSAAGDASVVINGNTGVLYLNPSSSTASSIKLNQDGTIVSGGNGKIQFGTGKGTSSLTGNWLSDRGVTTLSFDNSGNIEITGVIATRFTAQSQSSITVQSGTQLTLAATTRVDLKGTTALAAGSIVLVIASANPGKLILANGTTSILTAGPTTGDVTSIVKSDAASIGGIQFTKISTPSFSTTGDPDNYFTRLVGGGSGVVNTGIQAPLVLKHVGDLIIDSTKKVSE